MPIYFNFFKDLFKIFIYFSNLVIVERIVNFNILFQFFNKSKLLITLWKLNIKSSSQTFPKYLSKTST